MYEVRLTLDAAAELAVIPVYYRRAVEDAIGTQLTTEPLRLSRHRKPLQNLGPAGRSVPGFP